MMETIARRVAVWFSGRGDAVGDRLLGLVWVIRSRFLGLLAGDTDGLVVEHRKDPQLLSLQGFPATLAAAGTGQLFFPMRFHSDLPSHRFGHRLVYGDDDHGIPVLQGQASRLRFIEFYS